MLVAVARTGIRRSWVCTCHGEDIRARERRHKPRARVQRVRVRSTLAGDLCVPRGDLHERGAAVVYPRATHAA